MAVKFAFFVLVHIDFFRAVPAVPDPVFGTPFVLGILALLRINNKSFLVCAHDSSLLLPGYNTRHWPYYTTPEVTKKEKKP